jgi:GDPmannose 4,6-dehydratase
MKRALITGINGQDGSYLAELLLDKGYEVHGIVRGDALKEVSTRLFRLNSMLDRITLHPGSLDNYETILSIVNTIKPQECYHLAAESFVSYCFDNEFSSINTNINGTLHILSALRYAAPQCRFYFAGSSEMFGKVQHSPQDETTPFCPRSLYGISKVAGFHLTRNYRDSNKMFACSGILFNHESPRRGMEFVTRKITVAAARIKAGKEKKLLLGNLDARRDWGYSKEYVKAMWLMLQQDQPDDYVVATNKTHTVREFLAVAFDCAGLRPPG